MHKWFTEFPQIASDLNFLPANVKAVDLIEPIFSEISQPLLARIAANDRELEFRRAAIENIKDKGLLESLAKHSNWRIRDSSKLRLDELNKTSIKESN
jgi:hypothetical protein